MYVCYWGDILVAMCAVLPVPSGNLKHGFRPTRTVVLPDYQNLGIGTRFSEFIGDYYLSQGYKFYYRSSHLRLRDFWENSPYWVATSHNGKKGDLNSNFSNKNYKNERICGSYEYMGKNYLSEHIDLYIDYNDEINVSLVKEDLQYLKDKGYYITVITGEVKTDNPIDIVCQELGIRTQLLYYRGQISKNNLSKNIIRKWDSAFSVEIRNQYKKPKHINDNTNEQNKIEEVSNYIMDKKEKVLTFQNELKWIKDKDIRRFAIEMISILPDYFFVIPASSTGKYHPTYSLNEGGLVRHTKSAVLFAKTLLDLEMFDEQWNGDSDIPWTVKFTDTEKDIIITALLLHDGVKHGLEGSKYTVATHPMDMVNYIINNDRLTKLLDAETISAICACIASHMGSWNTDYKTKEEILPKPITPMEKFVHLCDYLASRRFLEVNFEKVEY